MQYLFLRQFGQRNDPDLSTRSRSAVPKRTTIIVVTVARPQSNRPRIVTSFLVSERARSTGGSVGAASTGQHRWPDSAAAADRPDRRSESAGPLFQNITSKCGTQSPAHVRTPAVSRKAQVSGNQTSARTHRTNSHVTSGQPPPACLTSKAIRPAADNQP